MCLCVCAHGSVRVLVLASVCVCAARARVSWCVRARVRHACAGQARPLAVPCVRAWPTCACCVRPRLVRSSLHRRWSDFPRAKVAAKRIDERLFESRQRSISFGGMPARRASWAAGPGRSGVLAPRPRRSHARAWCANACPLVPCARMDPRAEALASPVPRGRSRDGPRGQHLPGIAQPALLCKPACS